MVDAGQKTPTSTADFSERRTRISPSAHSIAISTEYPKPWTDEIARAADVIITMGCGDACPVFPGQRYEDWTLTDPAGQSIDVGP